MNLKGDAFAFKGHVAYTDPPDACHKVELPPNATDWIAVISKSANCGYHDQVNDMRITALQFVCLV